MKIVILDDDSIENQIIEAFLDKINEDIEYVSFQDPFKAIDYIYNNDVDLFLCDIEMPEMNGIDVAKLIKVSKEDVNIVFITCHEQYALNAFGVDAIGYLMKPVNVYSIMNEIQKVKKLTHKEESKRVYIRTFGNFDVFINGKVVQFKRSKAKEMLAVLVDKKGGYVTSNEMISYLFEDEPVTESIKSYYRNIRCSLQLILNSLGIADIITCSKGGCSLNLDKIECDYYNYLHGNEKERRLFSGEYMNNYSWAEETLAYLLNT